ncbi:MAG: hypothetical protein U0787_23295 [Polyangia bacterium]
MIWDSEVSATVATLVAYDFGVMLALIDSGLSQRPGLAPLTPLAYNLLLVTTMPQTVTPLLLVGQLLSGCCNALDSGNMTISSARFPTGDATFMVFYLWFLLLPLGLLLFVP